MSSGAVHYLVAVGVTTGGLLLHGAEPSAACLAGAVAGLGAILPDTDERGSPTGWLTLGVVNRLGWHHRGPLHSVGVALLVTAGVAPLALLVAPAWWWLALGWWLHLGQDFALTPSGMVALWPVSRRRCSRSRCWGKVKRLLKCAVRRRQPEPNRPRTPACVPVGKTGNAHPG